jgi:hypothetical protein
LFALMIVPGFNSAAASGLAPGLGVAEATGCARTSTRAVTNIATTKKKKIRAVSCTVRGILAHYCAVL